MISDALKALAAGAVAFLWLSNPAFADGYPCPPKRYFCWQVKLAASTFGEYALVSKAKSCGWSDFQINAARKCLK